MLYQSWSIVTVGAASLILSRRARSPMQQAVDAPTPKALADLVARCDQINRFEMQLTAVEEVRIAALASGILVMRQVLDLSLMDSEKLPMRQGRIQHWALTGGHLKEAETPAIHSVRGQLVLDEQEQVRVMANRTWPGQWRSVPRGKSPDPRILPASMMEFLARLTELAQKRAPDAARALLARSEAVSAAQGLLAVGP